MKKLILFLILIPLTAFSLAGFAEMDKESNTDSARRANFQCDRGNRHEFMHHMGEDMNLSDEQKKQVMEIMKEQHKKVRDMREEMRKQMEPKMEAMHQDTRARLAKVLDEDQMKKFDEKVAEMKERKEKMHDRSNYRMRDKQDNDDSDAAEKE